jgi:acetyl esterase/lipase
VNASVAYLVVSCIGALLTVLALIPGPRAGKTPALFFLSGWLVGDLAAFHIEWQAIATLVFVISGAFDRWPGWLGLGVTIASWSGLVAGTVRARRTGQVIETALAETLGTDYRSRIPDDYAGSFTSVPARPWSSPIRRRHRDVERIKDISYGPAGKRNLLDVYRPRSRPASSPVLIYIHGGAWSAGSKNGQGMPLMLHLASHGWLCVAPNYRLSPRASFPAHLVDVKRALAWVREHGAEFGADPTFVAVAGGSAGGHLAALMGLTANDPEYQPGFEEIDTSVAAVVPLYGAYDLLDRHGVRKDRFQIEYLQKKKVLTSSPEDNRQEWEKASPVSRVHSGAPPFFVLHGAHDSLLFCEDARYFVEALRAVSREPVAYAELPGAQHGFDTFHSIRSVAVVEGVTRLLAFVRSTRQAASSEQQA